MNIDEVELIPDFSQAQRFKHASVRLKTNTIKNKIEDGIVKKIGKVRNYTIYVDDSGPSDEFTDIRFYAVNNQTDLVDMTVDGKMQMRGKKFFSFEINALEGRSGSNLKAHEFYRAILLAMPIIFVSDLQSYGGMRTWQELSRYPDIEVFGWSDGQAVNIDPRDPEETHVDPKERYSSRVDYQDPELKRILNMKLVAHKRIKK